MESIGHFSFIWLPHLRDDLFAAPCTGCCSILRPSDPEPSNQSDPPTDGRVLLWENSFVAMIEMVVWNQLESL